MSDIKAAHKKMWASGDYFVVSIHVQWVSELLCESVNLRAGQKVLDIACGNGNTSLSAARRGCKVTGVDLTPELLQIARERATAERLSIDFQEGDAEELNFDDEAFDCVLSTFGIMFVPNRDKATDELLRILKPGGRIGLANWAAQTNVEFAPIIASYTAEPPPNPWTTEDGLRGIFNDRVRDLNVTSKKIHYRFASATDFIDAMTMRFGPWKNLMASLEEDAAANLRNDLISEVDRHNISGDLTLILPLDYLEIVAVKN